MAWESHEKLVCVKQEPQEQTTSFENKWDCNCNFATFGIFNFSMFNPFRIEQNLEDTINPHNPLSCSRRSQKERPLLVSRPVEEIRRCVF